MKGEVFVLKDYEIFRTELKKVDDRFIPNFDMELYIEEYTHHNRFIKDSFREEIDEKSGKVIYVDQILTNITWFKTEEKAKEFREKLRNHNLGK